MAGRAEHIGSRIIASAPATGERALSTEGEVILDDDLVAWLRVEKDRRAIEELHKHYFSLINLGESERVHTEVFSPDAEIMVGARFDPELNQIKSGVQVSGPGASGGGFAGGLAAISVPSTPIASNHGMMQCQIKIDGDTARSETSVNSFLVIDGEPRRVLVRGIRYLDKLVRRDEGWRISKRMPSHDWMFEADAAFALKHSERLQLHHLE
jgi:hypothetical protein